MTRSHFAAVLAGLAGAAPLAAPAAYAEQAPPPIAIQVEALPRTDTTAAYVITLRSNVEVPQTVLVTQRFVQDPAGASASDAGQVNPDSIVWNVELAPMQPRAVNSEAAFAGMHSARSTVCLADPATGRVLDCGTGDLAVGVIEPEYRFPWMFWLGIALAIGVIGVLGYLLFRFRARWWPKLARYVAAHRSGVAIAASALVLAVLAAGVLAVAGGNASQVVKRQSRPMEQSGWSGRLVQLAVGVPAATDHAEFTLYQWSCAEQETRTCVAVVSVRNTSDRTQQWSRRMQRLLHSPVSWTEPDGQATATANAGADVFATPLLAGERRMAVLVFTVALEKPLSQLELREGTFSRGVALDLR